MIVLCSYPLRNGFSFLLTFSSFHYAPFHKQQENQHSLGKGRAVSAASC